MFKKPFRIKSNTNIRNSERRKLRENVLKQYPHFNSQQLINLVPNKEDMSVSKFVTNSEKNVTCYFLNKNPILFEVDGILLPTVYALWSTGITLLNFEMPSVVFPVISGGADLMFAGIVQPPNGFPSFSTGTPCFVVLTGNGAAVAVGITACSKQDIIDNGLQGKRVLIYHCFKDHLWLIGDKSDPPIITQVCSTILPTTNELSINRLENITLESSINENEQSAKKENHLNDLPCQTEQQCPSKDDQKASLINEDCNNETQIINESKSVIDMDQLLFNCFCQALLNAKKIELPILVSSFSSQYLHPACPEGQRLDVKKSSYKKMSKFLAEMQSKDLVEIKQLSKGIDSLISISTDNDIMRTFKCSEFAKEIKKKNTLKLEEEKLVKIKNAQTVEVRELYAVSAKVAPFFKIFNISKGSVLSSSDVRQIITEYVKKNELNTSVKNSVTLDAMMIDIMYGKNQHGNVLTWDVLLKRMLDNMNPCHEVTIPGQKSVVRKGNLEYVEVMVEQRMGNKKVSIIKNLEAYGVDIKSFAASLQQMAASSALVVDAPGKSSNHHVVVQGVQHKHIKNLLDMHKIPKKYIKGLESADKEKKK